MKPLIYLAFFALFLSFSSCYRVPDEYDLCTIPVTNNPSITKEKSSGPIPAMKY